MARQSLPSASQQFPCRVGRVLGSPCRDTVHVRLQFGERNGALKWMPMAAKGSLVGFAVDGVASYRLRTVKGGTSLGHVLDLLGESVHEVRQRQG